MVEKKSLYIHELFIAAVGQRGCKEEKNETEIGKNLSDNIAHTLRIQDTHNVDLCAFVDADKTVWNSFLFHCLIGNISR